MRMGMPRSLAALSVESRAGVCDALKRAGERNIIAILDKRGSPPPSTACVHWHRLFWTAIRRRASGPRTCSIWPDSGRRARRARAYAELAGVRPVLGGVDEGGALPGRSVLTVRRVLTFQRAALDHPPLVEKLAASKLSRRRTWQDTRTSGSRIFGPRASWRGLGAGRRSRPEAGALRACWRA